MSPNKKQKMIAPIPPSAEVIDVESYNSSPISEHYSLHRDLHHAIAASLALPLPPTTTNTVICLSDDEDDVIILSSKPENITFQRREKRNREIGESSISTESFLCEICTETKQRIDSFNISGCSHSYCIDCVGMYVTSKVRENATKIRCPVPGCVGLLELQTCRHILSRDIFDLWGNALCEAAIGSTEKFYCPFKDCSALMIHDGGEVFRESQCPNCRRFFCGQCKVPWHDGINCEEFQKLNKDEREKEDIMLMKLAEREKWRRCPKCRVYVEKSAGCMYMKCRCGNAFCYRCGAPIVGGSHTCQNCRR